jgi:hypothetical protein
VKINIPDIIEKGNSRYIKAFFLPGMLILLALGGWGILRLKNIEKARVPVSIEYQNIIPVVATTTPLKLRREIASSTISEPKTGIYVASHTGKSYYLPNCSGAKRLSEKRKIWFDTKAEAEKFGFKPAKNCKGI